MSRVIHSPLARQDLAEIWQYIARDNMGAADRLTAKFDSAFFLLAQIPRAGRARDDLVEGIRTLPVGQYMIMYRQVAGGAEIMRIVHGARDLTSIPIQ